MAAIRPSRWPSRSPRCSPPPISPTGSRRESRPAYLRETADVWNSLIERWIYATETPLAKEIGVDGYYVRIAPPDTADAASPLEGFVPIKNRPPQDNSASRPR